MSKFKVGDKVRIVASDNSVVTKEMNNCAGYKAVVSHVYKNFGSVYGLKHIANSVGVDASVSVVERCCWPEDSLELVTNESKPNADKQLGIISVQDWVRIYIELTASSPCNALFKDQPMLIAAFFMVSAKLHQKLIKEGYIREE